MTKLDDMPHDTKYGDLFTLEDLEKIGQFRYSNRCGIKKAVDELRARGELTFPKGEPIFVLRGKDMLARSAVTSYYHACLSAGSSVDHTAAIRIALNRLTLWQKNNKDKMKEPDTDLAKVNDTYLDDEATNADDH